MTQNTYGFLFSGKIYCGLCGWKYRAKKERNKKVYICSKYSTGKAGGCERQKVDEEHLLFLIGQQLKIYDLSQDRLDLLQAVVVGRENITIYYTGLAPTHETKNGVAFGMPGEPPEKFNPPSAQ